MKKVLFSIFSILLISCKEDMPKKCNELMEEFCKLRTEDDPSQYQNCVDYIHKAKESNEISDEQCVKDITNWIRAISKEK